MLERECDCAIIKGIYSDRENNLRCTTCYKKITDLSKVPDFKQEANKAREEIKTIILLFIFITFMFALAYFSMEIAEPCNFDVMNDYFI